MLRETCVVEVKSRLTCKAFEYHFFWKVNVSALSGWSLVDHMIKPWHKQAFATIDKVHISQAPTVLDKFIRYRLNLTDDTSGPCTLYLCLYLHLNLHLSHLSHYPLPL